MTYSRVAILLTSILAAACRDRDNDDAAADSGSSSDGSTTGDALAPTFWQDVAPIYFTSCVQCHSQGGIAPFALDDYATAKAWASASAMAVADRTMPPWLVTDDASCGTFADSRALPPEAIDMIVAWSDAGAPEGTVRDDLVVVAPESLAGGTIVDLATPAFVPVAEGSVYAETDEYRCFVIDDGLATDALLTGYEVVPGNDALVHHVLVFTVDPTLDTGGGETNASRIAALDAESPDRAGWPCFGATGEGTEPSGVPVSWAPGQGITDYPEDTGVRVLAGEMLVAQIHYNLAGAGDDVPAVSTTVRLRSADQVEREGFFDLPDPFLDTLFSETPATLEPGQEAVDYTWELEMDPLLGGYGIPALDLYGVLPHMHAMGRSLRFDVVHADGSEDCGAEVKSWDFDWQLYYFYETPIRLGAGDRVRVTCTFDTREATEPVLPGWGTDNEMCLLGVYLVPAFD